MINKLIVGLDEVGRGPLAGPVIAAAVILSPDKPIDGLMDSKKLTEKKREALYQLICEQALDYAIGRAEPSEIDEMNILQASLLAMQRAFNALTIKPELALIDGHICPNLSCESQAIIKGDETEPVISAASIIAKVSRDREMKLLDQQYPHYGFARHKGYPTKAHIIALEQLGICQLHRRSFAPVKHVMMNDEAK